MKLSLLILAAKLIYKLMPPGYQLEVWKWPVNCGGEGNALVSYIPAPGEPYSDSVEWNMNKEKERPNEP